MIRAVAGIFLGIFVATPVAAQRPTMCPATEYAQLKDIAATPDGRRQLATRYCMWRSIEAAEARHAPAGRDRAACAAEMAKTLDALQASGDAEQIARARAGCPDLAPPK